jgi:hypothetical protein
MGAPTPWSRFVMPHQYAPSVTGAPLPGAKLYFWASKTAIPLATYADATLDTPNDNPVEANAAGVFPDIFLQSMQYKVRLEDANGDEIWTADPVAPFILSNSNVPKFLVAETTVDGNGGVPATGVFGDGWCPVACTITTAVLQSTLPGSLVLDVWVNDFSVNNPPVLSDSIVGSDPPTLSSSQSSIDNVLNGWLVDIPANSAFRYSITSIDNQITRFTLSLLGTFPQ